MGVFTRPDSKFYYLYLEPLKRRIKTAILVKGITQMQTREYRKLAEDAYHVEMSKIAREVHGLAVDRPAITFREYAIWYETHITSRKRGKEREQAVLVVLVAFFGSKRLTEIDAALVREWQSHRLEDGCTASTVNRETDVLKHLLSTAVPKYLSRSPISRLPRLHAVRKPRRVLTRDEEARLLKQLAPADRALVLMGLDTLVRLKDCLELKREQDHRGYLAVLDSKTTPYRVPVSTRLRNALNRLSGTSPYYFAHRRKAKAWRDRRGGVRQMLARACKRAKIHPPITFHCLRHTGATRLSEAKVPVRNIQAIGNWKSLRQLSDYMHPLEDLRAAVELIGPNHSRPVPEKRERRKKAS